MRQTLPTATCDALQSTVDVCHERSTIRRLFSSLSLCLCLSLPASVCCCLSSTPTGRFRVRKGNDSGSKGKGVGFERETNRDRRRRRGDVVDGGDVGRDGAHEAKRASHGRDGDGQMPADLHSDRCVRPGRFPDPHAGAVRLVRNVVAAAIHPRRFETERHGGAWNETERTCGGKPNPPPIRICFSSVNDERSPPRRPIPTVASPSHAHPSEKIRPGRGREGRDPRWNLSKHDGRSSNVFGPC